MDNENPKKIYREKEEYEALKRLNQNLKNFSDRRTKKEEDKKEKDMDER